MQSLVLLGAITTSQTIVFPWPKAYQRLKGWIILTDPWYPARYVLFLSIFQMTFAPALSTLLQAVISVNVPILPLPPSWSSHFQSLPRVTLAPEKNPLDCTLTAPARLPAGILEKIKVNKIREMVNFRLRLTRILLVDSKSEFIPVFIAEGN